MSVSSCEIPNQQTLDYLFYDLLANHGLEATYAFIRDRRRAIRTDFTIQHSKGPIPIECFERIARFHILAMHRFCDRIDVRGFDYRQEVEQKNIPIGLTPDQKPNSGTRLGLIERPVAGAADIGPAT